MELTENSLKDSKSADLKLFFHCIYEYKKGVRHLLLITEKAYFASYIIRRLEEENIDFLIQEASKDTINVFFGAKECIDVVKTFLDKKLNSLTPEQDFMLGIMLGYDSLAQCSRYLGNIVSGGNIKAS